MKFITIYSTILLAVFSCSKSSDQSKTGSAQTAAAESPVSNELILSDEQIKFVKVKLGKLENRQMGNTVKANGMLDVPPANLVTISAPLGGFVKFTDLLQGMKVKKGQLLLVMEHPDYIQIQQDYLESKSLLEFLTLEYQRQQELSTENVTAIKALQQSKSNYLSTKAKVEGLKAKLKLININPADIEIGEIKNSISIYSPITGFLTQVNVNIGTYVNPTDIMLRIVNTEHLHAEAQVFEKDVSKLVVGQTVRIKLPNETKERLAKVYLIGKEITPERTVRVHCHFNDEDTSLIPGMYFTAVIETERQSSKALPNESIVNFEGKDFIFVVDDTDGHHFTMQQIVAGISQDNYTVVEIPDSFADRSFVVKGAYELLGLLKNNEN